MPGVCRDAAAFSQHFHLLQVQHMSTACMHMSKQCTGYSRAAQQSHSRGCPHTCCNVAPTARQVSHSQCWFSQCLSDMRLCAVFRV